MSRLIKSLEYFCMFSSFPSISYLRNYILDSCRIYIYVVMWLTWSSEWAPNLASKLVDCSTKHATITIWWTMNARDWPGGSVRDVRDITCTKINAMILIEMIHKSILVCVRFYVNLFFFTVNEIRSEFEQKRKFNILPKNPISNSERYTSICQNGTLN